MVFFEKSPRHLTLEQAALLRYSAMGKAAARVALVVDPDDAALDQ